MRQMVLKITMVVGVGLIIALMLCGCSGGTSTEAPVVDTAALPAANWFPLKIGNSWTYAVTQDTSLINLAPGEKFIAKYTGVMSAPSKVTQGGLSWFKMHFAGPAIIGSYDALARHDVNGLLGKDLPKTAPREYAIKKPIKVGTTWKGGKTGIGFKITSLTKTVTVPKGTFKNCLVVVCTDTPSGTKTTVSYAPGVGKILVVAMKGTKLAVKWELKSYVLK